MASEARFATGRRGRKIEMRRPNAVSPTCRQRPALSYDRATGSNCAGPVMQAWRDFVTGADARNVIPLHVHEHA